jgi:hypothetical protein
LEGVGGVLFFLCKLKEFFSDEFVGVEGRSTSISLLFLLEFSAKADSAKDVLSF